MKRKLTTALIAIGMLTATMAPVSADTDQQVVIGTVATNLVITFNLQDPVDLGSMVIGLPNEAPGGTIDIDSNTDWSHNVRAIGNAINPDGHMTMYEAPGSSSFGCEQNDGSIIFATALADCDNGSLRLANGLVVNGLALTTTAQTLTTGNGAGTISLTVGQPVVNEDEPTAGTAVYRGTVEHTVVGA